MKSVIRPGLLIFTIAIPLCLGGISAMLTGNAMTEYLSLEKPPLSPPGWLFPIAWSILYVMMGAASYLAIDSGADPALLRKALIFYGIQLALNFFWSILFFNYSLYLLAFIELMVMWTAIIITTVLFFKARAIAGALMIPYILWTIFAAYLNFAVYKLSLTAMPLPE